MSSADELAIAIETVASSGPLLLLVIDDDEVDRQTIHRALKRVGVAAAIEEAATAAEGIERLESKEYDCILLDYKLPGNDGLVMLQRIRALRPETPVIVLTGHGDEEVAVTLMKAGAADYLPKAAVTPVRLAASVRYAVELAKAEVARQRMQRELRESLARTEHLQLLTVALGDTATPGEVHDVVIEHGVLAIGACAGAIAELVNNDEQEFELVASTGYPTGHGLLIGRRWPIDALMPLAESIRTGKGVFRNSPDVWVTPCDLEQETALSPSAPSQGWASLPLFVDGVPKGAMLWTFPDARSFGDADRAFMSGVAHLCMQALERARLRQAERQARIHAEAANRTKADFLARMSHDLRTPLNAIAGYVQLLELAVHGPINEAQRAALGRIDRAQHHLLQLINEILSFAKIEAGQVTIDFALVPVDAVLSDVRTLIATQAAKKGLLVEWQCEDPNLHVWADRQRLEQILVNLATNAVKFTNKGSIRLRCHASGPNAVIEVADTGPGIAPQDLSGIFEPFVQTSADTGDGGVGLGLAISRELAQLIGGQLSCESTLGKGSVFTLTLPRTASR